MKVIIIDENTEFGREQLEIMHLAKQSGNPAIVDIFDYDADNDTLQEPLAPYLPPPAFSRVPGLAYTDEERMVELEEAIEAFERGEKGMTMEELKEDMKTW